MKIRYRFGVRDHCGGLKESIASTIYIATEKFEELLPLYKFYAFDERVNQFMFILRDHTLIFKSYKIWLFIEIIVL